MGDNLDDKRKKAMDENQRQFLAWVREKRGIDSHGLQLMEAGKFRFREGDVDTTDKWIAKLKDEIAAMDRFIAENDDSGQT
jgi:hypothetical protein